MLDGKPFTQGRLVRYMTADGHKYPLLVTRVFDNPPRVTGIVFTDDEKAPFRF
jgi:hypothetical protein